MKVLLLGFGKIAYMPYMNFYLDNAPDNVEFELIYWDRDGNKDAPVPSRISKAYKFEKHLEEQFSFRQKLKYFISYRFFALKILKYNEYDRIIVLHTTPGLTICDYLARKYDNRYLLDFRDISYEYKSFYRKIVGYLARHANAVFVSSSGFRKFLPNDMNSIMIHNYNVDSLEHGFVKSMIDRKRDVLRVSYWGLVRQLELNKNVIDALGNDDRFELHYYGRMQQEGRDMEAYSIEKGYRNIFFHGAYMPEDRYVFAEQTDLIHNIYDVDFVTGNATGNKYYDGLIFHIPQICTAGSHMAKLISEDNVGLNIEIDDSCLADTIWNYYQGLDWSSFDEACDSSLEYILAEQKQAIGKFLEFVGGDA